MIFDFFANAARKISSFVTKDIGNEIENNTFLETTISNWLNSPERHEAIEGFLYYEGYHKILCNKRVAIGKGGELIEISNLPNRKDIDNQYAIAVDKKANYLLGKPISFVSENKEYVEILKTIFDKKMMKRLKNLAKKSMNGAVAWVFPFYDENGDFKTKIYPSYEILPFWKDNEHQELDYAIRVYDVVRYEGTTKETIQKVELYKLDGIYSYTFEDGTLTADEDNYSSYMVVNGLPYNWDKIPLIPFKYNDNEIPLIRRVKPLQDAINELMSMFHNNMLEDSHNTILVIENYDGTDLGEFRQNLSQYGAIKVRSVDGSRGGVSTLQVEVNASNYESILTILKRTLIENARSFDGKTLSSGAPNQMNILSMYQDIDIDSNDFESEYQSSLEELLYFINVHLALTGKGDFFDEEVQIIFNRDMLMNESEIMSMLNQTGVKISNKTLLSQVPFIDDVDAEIEQINAEADEAMNQYQQAFPIPADTPDEKNAEDDEE